MCQCNKCWKVIPCVTDNREGTHTLVDETECPFCKTQGKERTYKCGHKAPIAIFTDSNLLSISAYLTWKDDFSKEMCFDCYCKKQVLK